MLNLLMNNTLNKPEIIVKTFRKRINPADCLADGKPVWLEIGFGVGDFLLSLAKTKPDITLIGIELDQYRYYRMRDKIKKNGLTNLWIINIDADLAVEHLFEQNSADKVFINFPDPWPKNRHWKNRIFKMDFIDNLTVLLKPGGVLRIQTDVLSYAEHVNNFLGIHESLSKMDSFGSELPRTTFEGRFIKLGMPVYRLIYEKTD